MDDLTPELTAKLQAALTPLYLDVINESHHHSRPGNNTHFKVIAVSDAFTDQRLIQRHQHIYRLLDTELKAGIHALTLHTFTPTEWEQRQQQVAASPSCRGGSKVDN